MIDRYSRPGMRNLWSEEAKFRTWLDVEVLACEAWTQLGKIPKSALKEIQEKADFDIDEILEREKVTKHDVAAFVSVVQETIGQAGRYLHYGMTSSDVLDTSFAYRLKKSGELLLGEIDKTLQIAKDRANKEKLVPMIGRTHGIHAEPMTMGLKWALWYDMLHRSKKRLADAIAEVSVAKLSGAVGTYSNVPPEIEQYVAKKLDLKVDSISTQVIARDRIASYFVALSLLGSTVEAIAVELRHLQRTEVGEVREGFSPGQKGSSAMPHKRNPISAENLTGLARLLRSMAIPALEDVALWHERDISHSSVERVIAPDANILADYMLGRLQSLLSNLEIFPENMQKNLDFLHGVVYSQRVLLTLIEKGLSRDEAYEIIQQNSLKAIDSSTPLRELLGKDARVSKILPSDSLNMLFDAHHFYSHIDYVFKKVFSS